MKKIRRHKGKVLVDYFHPKDEKDLKNKWNQILTQSGIVSESQEEKAAILIYRTLYRSWEGMHSGTIHKLLGCHATNWAYMFSVMRKVEEMNPTMEIVYMQIPSKKKGNTSFKFWSKENWEMYLKYLDLLETHNKLKDQGVFPTPNKLHHINQTVSKNAEKLRIELEVEQAKVDEEERQITLIESLKTPMKIFTEDEELVERSVTEIAELMGIGTNGTRKALKKWQNQGIVKCVKVGRVGTGNAGVWTLSKLYSSIGKN